MLQYKESKGSHGMSKVNTAQCAFMKCLLYARHSSRLTVVNKTGEENFLVWKP